IAVPLLLQSGKQGTRIPEVLVAGGGVGAAARDKEEGVAAVGLGGGEVEGLGLGGQVGVAAQQGAAHAQRLAEERFGLVELPRGPVNPRQAVDDGGKFGVPVGVLRLGEQGALHVEGLAEEGLGLAVIPDDFVAGSEVVEGAGKVGVSVG